MADKFYNPLGEAPADWTSASKGFKANNVFGDIAAGVGDITKMAVTTADNYYQGTIKEQARKSTDQLFNDFGNDASVATEAGINANIPPQQIQQGADKLKLLQQAAQNGTLKDSSFWAQAELISRQLKSRYPGYWEQIDSTMSELVGHKPAIKLHAELQQELGQNKSKNEITRQNALEAARAAGLPEVFAGEQTGKPYPTDEINRMVASKNAIKWDQEYQNRQYDLKKSQNTLTEDDSLLAARRDAQNEMFAMLNSTTSPFFRNVEEYKATANQIEAYRNSPGGIPPELAAKQTQLASQIDSTVNGILNKNTLKYGSDVSGEKLKNNLSFLQDWAKNFTTNVASGDKNYTAYNVAQLKMTQDANDLQFINSNDLFRKAATLTRVLGPQAELAFEGRNIDKPVITDRDLGIQKWMRDDIMLNGVSISDTTKIMQKAGVTNPAAYDQKLTMSMNAITSPEIPSGLKGNVITGLYGDPDFLTKVIPAQERSTTFLKMSAPVMLNTIKDLYDKGQITRDIYDKHLDFVKQNAVQLIHDQAANVNSISSDRKSVAIYYNMDTARLSTKDVPYEPAVKSALGKVVARAGENVLKDQAMFSVERTNHILDRLKNAIKADGGDPAVEIPKYLEKAGIEVTGGLSKEDKDKLGLTGLEPAVLATENVSRDVKNSLAAIGSPEARAKALEAIVQSGEYGVTQ